jgi:tight adherence protein B
VKRFVLALTIPALLIGSAQPASAQDAVSIRKVESSEFPNVAVTVSTGTDTTLGTTDVSVVENGSQLEVSSVESLRATGGDVDVVLVIDTSSSMVGEPITSAVTAAREFMEGLPNNFHVGLVTFADTANVVVPITTDRTELLGALDGLEAGGSSVVNQALKTAAGMFSGDAQRNIVLLTDGREGLTGSTISLRSAVASVKKSVASVFGVGLESPDFDGDTLERIAELSGGNYSAAAATDLSQIYEDLSKALSNQFVVTYRSTADRNTEVELAVETAAGTDSVLFLSPRPEPNLNPGPNRPEPADPLLEGAWGLALVLVLFFGACFGVLTMLLNAFSRNRREQELARRISAPAGMAAVEDDEQDGLVAWMPTSIVEVGARVAEAAGWTEKLDNKLERAAVNVKPGEFIGGALAASVVGFFLGAVLFRNWVLALALMATAALLPPLMLSLSANRRKSKLQEQLPDILSVLASSLRAGHSFLQALDMVAKEVGEPASEEFSRLVTEVRLGRSATDALNAMAERIDSDDMKWAVLAVNIQRDVGGNLAELLDNVANTIREREAIRRQVKVLSAEGRLSIAILTGLPILIAAYIFVVNNEYLSLLWTTQIGLVLTGVAITLLVCGLMWMRKVVRIDV